MHPQALLDSCAELVALTLKFDHPADAVVARYFRLHKNLGPRERNTLAETVFNVLRKKLLLEAFAQAAPKGSGAKERKLAILGFFGPRDFLKSVLNDAEKTWLDRCDAVDVNANGNGLMDLHRHNLPEWLAAALKAQVGEGFWPLVASFAEMAPLDVRVNIFKQKRAVATELLASAAIKSEVTPYSPWGLRLVGKPALNKQPSYLEGEIEVQDEGSQLLALLVDAGRGEMVVDFCAGAGGKTLALGAAMKNTGRLYAMDTSAHRLDALKPRLARSGLSNVHPVVIAHERDERIKRLAGKIDRVLVDAPCTGLGTLRRNPDLKWRHNPQGVAELALLQAAILHSAARLLKPGGRLVYATCSVLPQENEAIAQAFSQAHPDFTPLDVAALLTALKVPAAEGLCTGPYMRLWPHLHQTDGFFAAVWQKT
ncbi:MAG: RsmB/NOP family class I SAM-dependent RNA methyltransferase [Burkholderiaceae bacterium]